MLRLFVLAHPDGATRCAGCGSMQDQIAALAAEFGLDYELMLVQLDEFPAMEAKLAMTCVTRNIKHPKDICDFKCGRGIHFGVPTVIHAGAVYVGTECPAAIRSDLEDARAGRIVTPRTQWRTTYGT